MFWKTFDSLCRQKGSSPSAVAQEIGFSNATATKWKKGSTPQGATLQKIADYFGVTTDYLMTGQESKPDDTDEMTDLLQELKTRPEMRMLFSLAKGATKEDVELAVAIIQRMRQSGDGE